METNKENKYDFVYFINKNIQNNNTIGIITYSNNSLKMFMNRQHFLCNFAFSEMYQENVIF